MSNSLQGRNFKKGTKLKHHIKKGTGQLAMDAEKLVTLKANGEGATQISKEGSVENIAAFARKTTIMKMIATFGHAVAAYAG